MATPRLHTFLEVALTLLLMFAVPFLIILIVIYSVLLSRGCPKCIIAPELPYKGKDKYFKAFVTIPTVFPLRPDISVEKLLEKYQSCPISYNYSNVETGYPFIASIIEDVYDDDIHDQRYVCTAAIVTLKWVVTSSACFKYKKTFFHDIRDIFVRAGSPFWSKGGSLHEVQKIVIADVTSPATIAAVKLMVELPRLPVITPIMLTKSSLYKNVNIFELIKWEYSKPLPLRSRRKFSLLEAKAATVYNKEDCSDWKKMQNHIFCSVEISKTIGICSMSSGFPVIIGNILIGIGVGEYCTIKKKTIYIIYDISFAMKWLEEVTGVYVEYV